MEYLSQKVGGINRIVPIQRMQIKYNVTPKIRNKEDIKSFKVRW